MKIAIVTSGFDPIKPGGVSSVVINMIASLRNSYEIEILSFANESGDSESAQILNPFSYKNMKNRSEFFQGIHILHFGAFGSEFEFLRYRKRRDLRFFFEKFDGIIVVTGVLQVANIVPKLTIPIVIQCATRLNWERKSRYPEMSIFRRLLLKGQVPFLNIQERMVLKSKAIFLAENSKMKLWLEKNSRGSVKMWYPGTPNEITEFSQIEFSKSESHFVSVGRFNEARKGWGRLFTAYLKAYSRDQSIPPLVVLGWGDFLSKDRLILEAAQKKCRIEVYSNAPHQQRNEKLKTASYFLQTSYEEGLGLAALEAMSFGVPLICSETDGSREYVLPDVTGKLVHQSEDFVEQFSELIIESRGWNRRSMSENCTELFIQKFSQEYSSKELQKILDEFLVK